MWDLPGPGLEPMSPALAGRFLTTAPPGKPWLFLSFFFFFKHLYWSIIALQWCVSFCFITTAVSSVTLIQKNQYAIEAHLGVADSGPHNMNIFLLEKCQTISTLYSEVSTVANLVFCVFWAFCFVGKAVFVVFLHRIIFYVLLYNMLFSFNILSWPYFSFWVCRSTLFSVITTF